MLPLLRQMGVQAELVMCRPGYVPRGGGILLLTMKPSQGLLARGDTRRAGPRGELNWHRLASHPESRAVARRMADAANAALGVAEYGAQIEIREDAEALQRGAGLAVFAHFAGGCRLRADGSGALGRPAEVIGERVASSLLTDLKSGATLDHFAADQIIPFAAPADGESRFRIPKHRACSEQRVAR